MHAGVLLSGGLDSSLVAAVASRILGRNKVGLMRLEGKKNYFNKMGT